MSECKKCCHDIRTKDRNIDGINYINKFFPDSCHSLLLQQVCDCFAWSNKPSAHGMLKNQLKPNLTITFDVSASHIYIMSKDWCHDTLSAYITQSKSQLASANLIICSCDLQPLSSHLHLFGFPFAPHKKISFLQIRKMVFLSLSNSISF